MIFKATLFCEVNGKFSPEESGGMKREFQIYLGDIIRKTLDGKIQYISKNDSKKYNVTFLSESQVKSRLGSPFQPNVPPTILQGE